MSASCGISGAFFSEGIATAAIPLVMVGHEFGQALQRRYLGDHLGTARWMKPYQLHLFVVSEPGLVSRLPGTASLPKS